MKVITKQEAKNRGLIEITVEDMDRDWCECLVREFQKANIEAALVEEKRGFVVWRDKNFKDWQEVNSEAF